MVPFIITNSETPIYEQIYNSIVGDILSGKLAAGDLLPSIRFVASELKISVISVKKAWEMLDSGGFVQTVVGKGTFVRGDIDKRKIQCIKSQIAMSKLAELIPELKALDISKQEVLDAIEKLY